MSADREIKDSQQTDCCIVGGGPAGAILALLLARQGISTTLLELHKDFEREFRGDTIHPSVMEILEEIGLADALLELPHTKVDRFSLATDEDKFTLIDLRRLKTKYPYITVLPQVRFLEFITEQAKRYPNFQLVMGANVQELIEEDGKIKGVVYRGHGGWHEVKAQLTVGADGRFSRLRQLVGFEPIKTSPPMDVLWFKLPQEPEEPKGKGIIARVSKGHLLAAIDRRDYWQIAYAILKGSYPQIREAGLEALRESIAEIAPQFSDRVDSLHDWTQISVLSVESSRLPQWYRPGLLLIGDAAHVMSPVAGVGINYAIQDAVVAANVLSSPLKKGNIELHHLKEVQHQREFPTRVIQAFQTLIQKQIIARALDANQSFEPPAFMRLPILRDIPPRLIAFGVQRVHVKAH